MASSTHAGVLLPQMLFPAVGLLVTATSWSFRAQLGVLFLQEAQRLPNSKLASDPRVQLPQCVLPSSDSLLTCFPQQTSLRLEPTSGQVPSPCSTAQPPSGPQPRQFQEYIRRFQ